MDIKTFNSLDKATREYFSNSAGRREWNRAQSCSISYREDLKIADKSPYAFKLRKIYGFKNNEKMTRAIAVCALWCEWKEKQTGKPVNVKTLPDHVKPCLVLNQE